MVLITIVNQVYKPTYNWGGHIVQVISMAVTYVRHEQIHRGRCVDMNGVTRKRSPCDWPVNPGYIHGSIGYINGEGPNSDTFV